jgi:hypothetical protein
VQNDNALKNGANALDLASNVGPRFEASGKPMIRKMGLMMNMVIHRLLVWTTTQSTEIARTIENDRVNSERALGHLTDPVADPLEKEFIVTRNEADAEARTIDESVVLCIRSDLDEDRKAQNEVVGTLNSSV